MFKYLSEGMEYIPDWVIMPVALILLIPVGVYIVTLAMIGRVIKFFKEYNNDKS
jgi:hypothetical protein